MIKHHLLTFLSHRGLLYNQRFVNIPTSCKKRDTCNFAARQLEQFNHSTRTSIGYTLLPEAWSMLLIPNGVTDILRVLFFHHYMHCRQTKVTSIWLSDFSYSLRSKEYIFWFVSWFILPTGFFVYVLHSSSKKI